MSSATRSLAYNSACLLGGALAINWLLQLWPMPIFPLWGCMFVIYWLKR